MGTLCISAGAVNSSSCQHSLGLLPENRPAALQGLHLEQLSALAPCSASLRFISGAAGF